VSPSQTKRTGENGIVSHRDRGGRKGLFGHTHLGASDGTVLLSLRMQPMKSWVIAGVETNISWPTVETVVEFRGHNMTLRPETDKLAASVVMAYEPPMTFEEAEIVLHEFLSVLAWVERSAISETCVCGAGHPIGIGKGRFSRSINPYFTVDYLPDTKKPKVKLALALYREALNVNSTPYKFLGFYKIINILYRNGNAQKAWINKTVELLDDHYAKERVAKLRKEGHDVGTYLYQSGRNAIAHAYTEPSINPVNPDEPAHISRLFSDLPVIRALAEYLIEKEFGVLSRHTVWQEHLYELSGFRSILGNQVVDCLKQKERVALANLPRLPKLNIRLRRYNPFPVFENLQADILEGDSGGLLVACSSSDRRVKVSIFLNFADERLQFDPVNGVTLDDDGSAKIVRLAIDRLKFIRGLYLNGEVEVWDAEKNALLGRCNAFIPRNIDLREVVADIDDRVAALEGEARQRKEGQS